MAVRRIPSPTVKIMRDDGTMDADWYAFFQDLARDAAVRAGYLPIVATALNEVRVNPTTPYPAIVQPPA